MAFVKKLNSAVNQVTSQEGTQIVRHSTDELLMSIAADDSAPREAKKAFAVLFEKYHKPIIQYLWNSLSDFQLAQDISHDVFLKAFRSRKMYRSEYRFTTWLWTIAKRTLIDHQRKRKDLLFEDVDGQEIGQILDDQSLGIEDGLIQKLEKMKLQELFKKLGQDQREVLSLRIFSEMKFSEIAQIMDIKENTAKSLAIRARAKLIQLIRDEEKVLV